MNSKVVRNVFSHEPQYCWKIALPHDWPSDDMTNQSQSEVELFEDGKPLGQAHQLHDDIRLLGGGRYSHWCGTLYFSTSDNSDPNTNGRTYQVRFGNLVRMLKQGVGRPTTLPPPPRKVDSPLYDDYVAIMRGVDGPTPPVNLQRRSAQEVQAAAEYSVRTGMVAVDVVRGHGAPLDGVTLELGPGLDFGSALLLGEASRELVVADRFLAPWQADFHLPVYQAMQRRLARPSRLLDEVVRREGYHDILRRIEEPAWDLKSISDNAVDLVYSNAVLEHVHPLPDAVRELYRITAKGGFGFHQIDFRYHRNSDFPLEHLLFTREEFARLTELKNCEAGTQWRVKEAVDFFIHAGFEVVKVDVNMFAKESYLKFFLPRLRASEVSPYRDWPQSDLEGISARIIVRKT